MPGAQLQSEFQLIQEVPPLVLDEIFCFLLDIPNQLCFALTCRYLYVHYKSFVKTWKSLRLAHLMPHEAKPMFCVNGSSIEIRHKPRIEFLRRLEDARWKYCSGCWSLHQKSAWEPPPRKAVRFPLPLIKKINGGEQQKCMPYARQIDLCSCWTITFPEKRRLIREATWSELTPLRIMRLPIWHHVPPYSKVCHFGRVHSCKFRARPFANLDITSGFALLRCDSKLRQISMLSFQIAVKKFLLGRSSEVQSHSRIRIRTPTMSPHENLRRWLGQFFAEADSSFSIVGRMEDCEIKECHCWRCDCLQTADDNFCFDVVTRRNLGSGKWPEDTWYREFVDLTTVESQKCI
jgi:hypothetical protein